MWPLLGCSLMVLTVVLERALFWFLLRRQENRAMVERILDLAASGHWDSADRLARTLGEGPVIRVLAAGILHRHHDMSGAMLNEASQQLRKMSRAMNLLDTIITVAPLLGILGTVLGIIDSFRLLGTGNVSDPKMVTGGIAQALISTAAGLTISIITVFPYNFFRSRIDHAAHIMETTATGLEVAWKKSMGALKN
ncbi:MotA/TolQ/ExbB proton channel family protein [Desulfolithobacter sp.]